MTPRDLAEVLGAVSHWLRTPSVHALFRGDRGDRGERGIVGPQGDDGPQGRPGWDGLDGAQGEKGERGPKGETGQDGLTVTGPRGVKGDKGDKGDQGDRGERGKQGERGIPGPTPAVSRVLTQAQTGGGGAGGQGPQGEPGAPGAPGTTLHSGLSDVTSDQHHAQNHATRHVSGGADAVKLDDLLAPDDNIDLNATTGAHGLLPKLGGGSTNFLRADGTWNAPASGGGAPTTADYLVGTADAGLSGEIVVGTSPGGELGGTWASPTVDATHSGSAHHAQTHATAHQPGGADTMAVDAAAATGSLRTLGAGAAQAAAGDHATTHASTTGKTANDHHNQAHTHPAEGAVVVTHASTTGQGVNDHHARDHATTHQPGGADAMAVDAAVGTGSLRTLGTGALQAAVGSHIHGGGGAAFTAFTKDLGVARSSGTFDITGLTGLTPDKVVDIVQTAAQIATKGNARDEAEMDLIRVTGYVVDATTIRAYWSAPGVMVGDYAFAYVVSG